MRLLSPWFVQQFPTAFLTPPFACYQHPRPGRADASLLLLRARSDAPCTWWTRNSTTAQSFCKKTVTCGLGRRPRASPPVSSSKSTSHTQRPEYLLTDARRIRAKSARAQGLNATLDISLLDRLSPLRRPARYSASLSNGSGGNHSTERTARAPKNSLAPARLCASKPLRSHRSIPPLGTTVLLLKLKHFRISDIP